MEEILLASRQMAPKIAGSEIKNEYSPANSLENPKKRPDDIVVPDRESPGNMASACANPTSTASLIDVRVGVFPFFGSKFRAKNKKRPVRKSVIDTIRNDENVSSKKS